MAISDSYSVGPTHCFSQLAWLVNRVCVYVCIWALMHACTYLCVCVHLVDKVCCVAMCNEMHCNVVWCNGKYCKRVSYVCLFSFQLIVNIHQLCCFHYFQGGYQVRTETDLYGFVVSFFSLPQSSFRVLPLARYGEYQSNLFCPATQAVFSITLFSDFHFCSCGCIRSSLTTVPLSCL